MCGVSGFTGTGSLDDLKRMTSVLRFRGPDDEGFWNDGAVYLGHRRLSIIDIGGGRQPMATPDHRFIITYNGEIYNHLELRQALEARGHVFRTDHSDTEALLHGYLEWGRALPTKLNGMWAFAIYDSLKKTMFLSRDRFGKKPLFYTLQNQTFVFASELNALVCHPAVERSLSELHLAKYFAYGYIPAPGSIYKKIFKLPAGHNLELNTVDLSFAIGPYWTFAIEPFESMPDNPEEAWGEEIRECIDRAVKRRMMSDVPLGVFLSGGIDSSTVAYFAAKRNGGQKLKTYSIGFEEASFDESDYSRKVAGWLGTDHHAETLSIESAHRLLPEIVSKLDEPMGDSSLLPAYLLCRNTRKHVAVALGGDGADELFAGYDPFRAIRRAECYNRFVPRPVHRGIRMLADRLPVSLANMSVDFKIKRTLRGLSYSKCLWNPIWLGPLCPSGLNELFFHPFEPEEVYSEAIDLWESSRTANMVEQTLLFYTRFYLQDDILVKVDRASMMNSLEVRAPFLDIELVDLARRIPHQYKFRNGQTKYIFKKAMETILPREIIHRSKKGFGVPVGQWFNHGVLSVDGNTDAECLNQQYAGKRQAEHEMKKADHRAFLWNYWLFANWCQYQN